jgi:hypothetical protein
MKPIERDITLMYGDAVLERRAGRMRPPRSPRTKQQWQIVAIVTALVVAGLVIGYIRPLVSIEELPLVIKRDVHVGASMTGVKLYLGFRAMDTVQYAGDAAAAALDEAKERQAVACPGFVGDLSAGPHVSTVVVATTRALVNGQAAVSASFFFDEQGSLVGYRVQQTGKDPGGCGE